MNWWGPLLIAVGLFNVVSAAYLLIEGQNLHLRPNPQEIFFFAFGIVIIAWGFVKTARK